MLKNMCWNAFKNTGNIVTFMEFKQIENIEKNLKAEKNGSFKNQGYCNIGK